MTEYWQDGQSDDESPPALMDKQSRETDTTVDTLAGDPGCAWPALDERLTQVALERAA